MKITFMQISFSPIFGFPYNINGDGTFFGSQATFETKLLYASQYWQAAKMKIFSHTTSNLCLQQNFQHVLLCFFWHNFECFKMWTKIEFLSFSFNFTITLTLIMCMRETWHESKHLHLKQRKKDGQQEKEI